MAIALSVENLASYRERPAIKWMQLLLRVEAWLDERTSRRALYGLDDAALADLGLSRTDVERINHPHAG
jgi:uncharacterized protein YjiS (DUF1127 family)